VLGNLVALRIPVENKFNGAFKICKTSVVDVYGGDSLGDFRKTVL